MESNNISKNDHRFICKSVDSTTVYYTKISIDAEVDTEYPRGLDDNVEILGREAERLEEKFKKAVIRCKSDLEQQQCHEALVKRKDEEIDDDEDDYEPIGVSPCGRFFKYNKEVGRGSFKTVFRGLDTQTGVAVAWCELMDDKVNKEERIRFREEADMLKNLQHPNILRFYNYWETTISKKKNIVLVTELMLSGTLKSYLSRFKKINPKVLKSWCRQILKGLHFLHSRKPPIIHRDVKCDNVFITGTTGSVKIGDLGLATLKNRSFAKSVIGTPEFMAPEMYDEHYDEAVDVYAFGMCMLEMATGEYPYSECSGVAQIYKRVTSGTMPESIEKVGNKELREIIERCITLNKNDRPNCMGLLKSEFFAIDMGTPIEPIRLEPIAREKFIDNPDITSIEFQLRFLDPKKRLRTHREDEAIQFHFDVNKDDCDRITQEMCKANVTAEEDSRTVAKLLKSQILLLLKEREERSLHRQLRSNGNGVNESSLINSHQNGSPLEQNGIPQYREIVSRSQQPNVTKSVINIRAKTSATQLQKKPSRFTVNPTTIEPPQQAAALVPQHNHSNIQHANLAQKHSSPTIIPVCSPSDQPTTQRHVQLSLHATNKTQTAHTLNCRSSETLMPKLIVLTVQNETVHCQLEAMGKVIHFKLDANVSTAVEVTKELIFSGQLAESQSSSFIDIINDIIKQLKEHPNQLPVINQVQEISEQAPSIIPVPKKRSQPSLQPLVNIPESTASQAEPSSLSPLTIEQIAKASSKITELADLQIELARLNQRVSVFVTEQHHQVQPKQLDAETTVTTPVKTDSNSDFGRSSSNPAAPLHISVSMSSSSATNTLSTATSGLSSTATSPSTQSSAENTNIDDCRKPRKIIVSLVDDVTKPTCKVQPQNIVDSPSSLSTSGADEILIMEKSLGTPPSPPSAANSKEQVLNEEEEEEEENTTVPPPPSPEITDTQTTVTTIKSICTLDRMRIEKDIVAINIPPQSVYQDVPDQTAETLTDMEKLKKSSASRLSTLADDDAQSICTAHPHLISSMDIRTSLERVRNQLTNVRLETNVRQRLVLLIQRQHIEEEELRLKHLVELEKFHKTLETRYHIPKSLFNVKPSVLSSSSNESLEY